MTLGELFEETYIQGESRFEAMIRRVLRLSTI